MTDHDALLRAIADAPAEDTPRLAFADWLDENADTFPAPAVARVRAAFIRDDVALSRRDECDPARLRWELIEKPQSEAEGWVRELPWFAELLPKPLLRRGFPWGIRLNARQFLASADRLFEATPVTTLTFTSNDGAAEALFRSPPFARITGLRVHRANLVPRAIAALETSGTLEELDGRDNGLSAPAVAALLRSPLFARLTRFDLGGGPVAGFPFISALSAVAGPVRLRELSLARAGLAGEHLRHLLTANAVAGVERLWLGGNRIGPIGHEAVARLPLAGLRDLDLSETAPTAAGVRALSTSLTLARLERLAYRQNNLTGPLLAELAACPEAANLRALDIASNAVGNTGATAVARSPHLAGLLVLNLSYCMVGDEGVQALLESPLADGLVLLDLSGSPASAETKELLKARMGDRVRV